MAEKEPGEKRHTQKRVRTIAITLNKNVFNDFKTYSLTEIIKFVKSPELLQHGVFRPALNYLDIPNYIRKCLRLCWEEDPEVRPDIRLVRVHLKELQAGL